jgi:acyl dehydratase
MEHPPPLPASGPLLLRALFKRARPGAGAEPASAAFVAACLDAGRLARYNALLGFPPEAIPLTFHYLLAQRAQLATMLAADLPFRIAGMIHVANDLSERGHYDPARPLVLRTSAAIAPPRENGAVHLLLHTAGEQDGRAVFSCASDYLAVRGRRASRAGAAPAAQSAPLANWSLDSASGRRYAAVSGDWNPIHLSRWTAKLMGMRTPIIHGMHTVAKSCAALEDATGKRVTAISARFTAPIPLPGRASLSADVGAGTYATRSDGRDAVTGSFTLAAGWESPAVRDEASPLR